MFKQFCECYSDLSGPIPCPVLGSITPLFIPNSRIRPIRLIGLCASLITFLYPILRWLPYENINLYMGIDGISLFFVILTTFLIPICISVGWSSMRSYGKEYITTSLILEFLMIAFLACFGSSTILCSFRKRGSGGSRQRKIKEAYQFSHILHLGSRFYAIRYSVDSSPNRTTDLQISLTTKFSERRQIFLWIAYFASFAVKVPMVLVHIWIRYLGRILLKLGTYGFLRFSIPMFPEATLRFHSFHLYSNSYESVTIGMFIPNIQGIGGSIPPMSSHGPVPPTLFLCIGVLYDRHKTRLVRYYGGSMSTMPNLSTIFFSSTLANMSSPVGAFQRNSLVATLAALGMILGAAYSLWLYNRAVSGNLKPDFLHKFSDPNGREVSIFIPFIVGVVRMGVHPKVFSDRMHTSVKNLVQHGKFH
ncbi:hypothetical protein MKW92_005661 [Papaver armeniacum]|nr:hypothetical protein MKW92_005661 [Papaver armeniacum]